MNPIMRCIRKNKRAIVGIEAAIVLIAFVVIAAALAYVVINMGFYAGQKAKSTIDQGVSEATSALQQDGFVAAWANGTGAGFNPPQIQCLAIPVKLAVGKADVDLNGSNVVVSVMCTQQIGTTWVLSNVYNGTMASTNNNLTSLMMNTNVTGQPTTPVCYSYRFNSGADSVLNGNEKAYFVFNLGTSYTLPAYSDLKIEIRTGTGAALMVMRDIPGGLPSNGIVDLK
jgi:flagellin FlaB